MNSQQQPDQQQQQVFTSPSFLTVVIDAIQRTLSSPTTLEKYAFLFLVLTLPTIILLSVLFFKHLRFWWVHFFRQPHDLQKRYTPSRRVGTKSEDSITSASSSSISTNSPSTKTENDCYAVITGSLGIALGFALELATKHGFNIVLMSRKESNLETGKQEVLKAAKEAGQDHVQVRTLQIDFAAANSASREFWEKNFFARISDIVDKVAILVNNVGCNFTSEFDDLSVDQCLDLISVNCTSQVLATRMLLPHMIERNKKHNVKSAVISLSSVAALRPLIYISTYSAAKAFVDMFSRAMHLECEARGVEIDFLSVVAGYVTTERKDLGHVGMSKLPRSEKGLFVLDELECARGALNMLGHIDRTYGSSRHCIYALCYGVLPNWWIRKIRESRLKKKRDTVAADTE